MKGAFEFGFVMMFSLPILVFGLNFIEIVMTYNQARHYQQYAVTQIEYQNRLDDHVRELIDQGQAYCPTCTIQITPMDQRYDVQVTFPIHLSLIHYHRYGVTHMLTQNIK